MAHLYSIFQRQIDSNSPSVIKMLSDTPSDLVKLNHGKFSKYHLCPSKIDMAHVHTIFFKDKSIQNGPKVSMVLSDTLDKLNYGEYRKYQLY